MSRKFIEKTIYGLKRRYGEKITIHRSKTITVNVDSGAASHDVESWNVKDAIVLPNRVFSRDLGKGAGAMDFIDTQVIVDMKSLPVGFVFNKAEVITIGTQRYKIVALDEAYNSRELVLISLQGLKGDKRNLVHTVEVSSHLELTSEPALE